jgi:alginate O-acetyltransferase complex protein AlgJ
MQRLYRMSRYFVPVVFFGYAPFANLAVYGEPGGQIAPFDMAALKGTVTHSFDTLYKSAMPHREASIGLMGATRYLLIGEGRKGVLVGQDGWLFTAEEARPLPENLGATLQPIVDLRNRLAAQGTELVLVPVPAKVDVAAGQADQPELSAELAGFYDAVLTGLRAEAVPVVDARAAMLNLDDAFFATDTHWTPAGAAGVAEAVALSGFLTRGSADLSREDEAPKQFAGDLVSYVTSAELAPAVGLATEAVTPYLVNAATDTTDIFAAAAVDVVLVGTSYSANPDWSFAEALKSALQSDVLNVAEQGQGPVRPMDAYLASASYAEAPPKVLIWEFPLRYLTDPALWDGHISGEELASAD